MQTTHILIINYKILKLTSYCFVLTYWYNDINNLHLEEIMTLDTKSLIVGSFLTLAGMLISHFYHKYEKRKTKHEKAIEVAKEYESIMTAGNFSIQNILYRVLKKLNIIEKLSFLDSDTDSLTFDQSEAKEKIGTELIKEYHKFVNIENTEFIKILSNEYTPKNQNERAWRIIISKFDDNLNISKNIYNMKKVLEKSKINIKNDKDDEDEKIFLAKQDLRAFIEFLMGDFSGTYDHVRNKLEWMSMFFVTGVAESDTVYQSLHQGYFSLIQCFYIDIASFNDKNVYDRYYVNMTKLYKIWRKIYNKKASRFAKQKNKSEKLIGIGRQRV